MRDRAATARRRSAPRCEDVEKTLVLSVVLVVVVVFAFLRSGRATLVPSVAMPLSLLGTFGVMWLLGYSIDNLSLMALTISTGFVVDDAIVVTENITRAIEHGDSRSTPRSKGAEQIGFTIVSITISLLAVFVPILADGRDRRDASSASSPSRSASPIAVSALVSLTLTPMMCSRMLTLGTARRARLAVPLVRSAPSTPC